MNIYAWVSLGIFLLGIVFFFILIRRRAYRDPTAAQNYERIRNKLTLREYEEPEEEAEEVEYTGGGLSSIISGFIVALVGCSLLPIVQEAVVEASGNVTGASTTILGLTGVMFGLAIVGSALSMVYRGVRGLGLL